MRLILASASESRLRLMQGAGLCPEVIPSDVAEDGVDDRMPEEAVLELARRKTLSVAGRVGPGAVVVGCDSLLEFEGALLGKPASALAARERWMLMRGREGMLHTGHCVVNSTTGVEVAETDSARVRFGHPTEREIDAYVASGEPLRVAGAFTLEGRSAPWIDSIDGNYGTVTGISMPVLRRLLVQVGVELVDFWH